MKKLIQKRLDAEERKKENGVELKEGEWIIV